MNDIIIEDNIPIYYAKHASTQRVSKYAPVLDAILNMKPKQSLKIPIKYSLIRTQVSKLNKKFNIKLVTRAVDAEYFRMWRVE